MLSASEFFEKKVRNSSTLRCTWAKNGARRHRIRPNQISIRDESVHLFIRPVVDAKDRRKNHLGVATLRRRRSGGESAEYGD